MCPYEEKITAFLLGDLSPEDQQALTRHFDMCASCRNVRDELSRVVIPLRSGLEKDKRLHIPLRPLNRTAAVPRHLWWQRHEWLRHAALFAVSFCTLFALINVAYRQTVRRNHDDAGVTHITFQRQEIPAPELKAAGTPLTSAQSDLSDFKTDAFSISPSAPEVLAPAIPVPEKNMPKLHTLVTVGRKEDETENICQTAPSAPLKTMAKKEKSSAKREQAKDAYPFVASPIPSDLVIKPLTLVGMIAPTNTVSTNTVSTNSVSPALKRMTP